MRRAAIVLTFFCYQLLAGPQPPCGAAPSPPYPPADAAPAVQVWNNADWVPPGCTGWLPADSTTLVATAARFRNPDGVEGLRRRIGAISKLAGLLYWSTTQKRWQPLIVDASALAAQDGVRRSDFSPDEIVQGRSLFAEEHDNLLGKGTYRIRIAAAAPGKLVFATENVTTLRFLGIPIFAPGEIQSICFLERESKDVWRYYALARMGKQVSLLVSGHEASLVNRAVASYRFLAGIPANLEPPAAR